MFLINFTKLWTIGINFKEVTKVRINKYLAECGVASRRHSEKLVVEGKVKLNGKTITNLATDVNIDNDTIMVDGIKVELINKHVYIMLNKPKGYVCTTSDDKGRKTVIELIKSHQDERIFPVGRLDYETEGLLLLTTDGDMSNRLMHPRHEVPKTYIAKIEGEVTEAELEKIRAGVILDGEKTKKCKARVVGVEDKIVRVEVVISEGRNRQVRRMFESINREVIFLKRVAIGDIKLGGLYRGEYRDLKSDEIEYLKNI